MAKKRSRTSEDPTHKELIAVKKLLAALLLRDGLKRSQLAKLLDVDAAVISRMVPKGVEKRVPS